VNIVVGVTASIAAYKSLDLVNTLRKKGHDVRVVMTENATHFVGPLSFESLSKHPVITGMFNSQTPALEHITLAKWCQILIIAPASADFIAKAAAGIADDFLSTMLLAFDGPVLVAPAMNTVMYEQAVIQKNISLLKQSGYEIIEPASGLLACGDIGKGKLAPVDQLIYSVEKAAASQFLAGIKLLVTAGPTIAPIDPVRYVTNHSSGKMGMAIAEAAALHGAQVTVVAGATDIATPFGVRRVDVATTVDMLQTLENELPSHDALIMAAAPADFIPEEYSQDKIKKEGNAMSLTFKKNPDILKSLKPLAKDKVMVGFAAESRDLIDNAQKKLEDKGLDFIVANNIKGPSSAFQSDYNTATLLFKDGRRLAIDKTLKTTLAERILEEVDHIIHAKEENH
jgi:phosphopantothenoylcysteine decarboxylase/phosphopantothenate--cysteine ligase